MAPSVLSRFVQSTTQFRQRSAMVVDGRPYTYGDVSDICCAICMLLHANGVRKGDRVGILTESNVYTYASVLAIMSCGGCYVPITPENPAESNIGAIGDAGVRLLLYAEMEAAAPE